MNGARHDSTSGTWQHILRWAQRDRLSGLSALVLLLLVLAAIAAPLLTSYVAEGLGEPNPFNKLLPPSVAHVFGTDHLGRDLYARVLFGARASLGLAAIVVALAALIGTALGLLAGYMGGWVDEVLQHITNVFLAFPQLLLAIALTAAIGAGFLSAVVAIALTWWPWYARLVRGQVLTLRNREFVSAARALGGSDLHLVLQHILPNILTPLIVQATADFGAAILAGASLSFLGLGIQPPDADWGQLVSAGRVYFPDRWWYAFFPGAAIFMAALSSSLLGDGLSQQ